MKLKTGKQELAYLLDKVLQKYNSENDLKIRPNTNPKNYEPLAKLLTKISHALPNTADQLDHDPYPPDNSPKKEELEYPDRKYDITPGQIKDACMGISTHLKSYFRDSCYIYLFGVGRKGVEKNPLQFDSNLADHSGEKDEKSDSEIALLKNEHERIIDKWKKQKLLFQLGLWMLVGLLIFTAIEWYSLQIRSKELNNQLRMITDKWATMKNDMNILPYHPTKAEIDALEGVWLCYTGSPQARSSDQNRYHMVVSNVVNIHYKDGYFTFDRYGASFDHTGYMQFEARNLISIHSYVKNDKDSIESPRHSLMLLSPGKSFLSVISASWSFDAGNRNQIIGIREIYIKQGKGGSTKEIINTRENVGCGSCKIIQWTAGKNQEKFFYLKNELLDSIPADIRNLLDEKSILLREPQPGLIITSPESSLHR